MRGLLSSIAYVAVVCGNAPYALAQDPTLSDLRPPTSVEIPMEETAPVKRNLRVQGLQDVSTWADSVAHAASQKGGGAIASLKPEGVDYLAVLYLFWAKKLGACPFILESVLEADTMASQAGGAPQCEVMSRLWRRWIDMDGDKRLEFLVSVGSAPKLAEFNASARQRFVKCKDTVASALAQKDAFSSRYGAGTTAAKNTATLKAIVSELI